MKAGCQVRTQVGRLELLKEAHTAIVHARNEGELSLAAAQLNGVLRRKCTRDGRSGHGHSGVYISPTSHLADLGAVAISADYVTLLRDAYAIDPIAHIARVRTAAIVVARHGMFGRLIRQMVATRRERLREHQIAMVVWSVPVCVRRVCVCVCDVGTAQRQRRSLTTN